MAVNGTDIVEQLRGRMRFYHVGDPVRRDMERACAELIELRARAAAEVVTGVTGDGLSRVPSVSVLDAASVGAWMDAEGVKLLPWQRTRLGLAPVEKGQDLAPVE